MGESDMSTEEKPWGRVYTFDKKAGRWFCLMKITRKSGFVCP